MFHVQKMVREKINSSQTCFLGIMQKVIQVDRYSSRLLKTIQKILLFIAVDLTVSYTLLLSHYLTLYPASTTNVTNIICSFFRLNNTITAQHLEVNNATSWNCAYHPRKNLLFHPILERILGWPINTIPTFFFFWSKTNICINWE